MALMLWAIDVPHIPVSWARAPSVRGKLSNSGDTLKLLVPNHIWKYMSGWTNYSGMVISQKMIEREIGYRGSKSITNLNIPQTINKSVVVKEQRVDGSYVESNAFWLDHQNRFTLRCTLMGSERNYQIKTLSKIHSNPFNSVRPYSTDSSTSNVENTHLDPWGISSDWIFWCWRVFYFILKK